MHFIFLKKLYKKILLNRIYELKRKSAQFLQTSETAKCGFYLNNYLDGELSKIEKYGDECVTSHQNYLDTQEQISRLEEKLKILELSIVKHP